MKDQELKKKFDTTKMSVDELKMCKDQDLKMKFDTTKTSVEDLKMCEDAPRPGGGKAGIGGALHQGGVNLSKAGRYPVVLAGVAVLTGIGTAMYYKSTLNVQDIVPESATEALNSLTIPAPATGPADASGSADACRC